MAEFVKRLSLPEEAPPWGLLAAITALVIAFLFMGIVGSVIGLTIVPGNPPMATLMGWTLGGVLVVVYVWLTRRTPADREALRLVHPVWPLILLFAMGFGVAVTLDLLVVFSGNEMLLAPEMSFIGEPGAVLWLWAILFLMVVQPVAEELVFRGVLYPALRAAQGVWVALLVSSIFYGLFHQLLYPHSVGNAGGIWYSLLEPLLAGLFLGTIRAYTRSTWAAIVTHVGFGTFALLKTLLIFDLINQMGGLS